MNPALGEHFGLTDPTRPHTACMQVLGPSSSTQEGLREVQAFTQSHTAGERQTRDSTPGLWDSRAPLLPRNHTAPPRLPAGRTVEISPTAAPQPSGLSSSICTMRRLMELPGCKPESTTESPERFSAMLRPGHHHRLTESEFLGMGPMYLDFFKNPTADSPHCWRRCKAAGTLTHCWCEYEMVQPFWKTVWQFLTKLNIVLPYDPTTVTLPGIHSTDLKICEHTKPACDCL